MFSQSIVIFQNSDDYSLFVQRKLISLDKANLILGSGVDTNLFIPMKKDIEGFNILFAGRILKTKGILELLKASVQLFEENYTHTLYLAGELDPMNPDTLLAEDLTFFQKFKHIVFLGNIDNMLPYYAKTHVACLPSYREGLPKFLLEAMSCSIPIVTTDTPGCRELVEGNGKLVLVGDVKSLKEALRDMIIQKNELSQMGLNSRLLAEKKFSLDNVLEKILTLYN